MQEKSLTMLADAPLTPTERRRSLIAVIACISVVGMGLGVSIPLLALLMERSGVPASLIGLNTAMPALATFVFTPFIPGLLRRVPAIAFLLGCIAVSAIAMPAYYLFPSIWLWFFIRFVNGLALTGLFVVSEFWINTLADEKNRGRLIGIYGTVLSCGFASGPILLFLVGTEGMAPFAVIACVIAAAALPLLLFGRGLAPRVTERPTRSFASFFIAAPAATLAGLVYGATETDIFNMLPVYGVRIGMTEQTAAFVLSIFAAGNILCQIPIGLWADRADRRFVLLVCALIGLLGTIAIPFVAHSIWLFAPTLFLFGGVVVGLYTVGLTLLGERFRGADLASANAAFVMMYSIGALIGPPLSGAAMDLWDPHGLIVAMGGLCGLYVLIAGWRYFTAPRIRPAP
ncbi:MAG TPA: MFS transporter [Alphaproteobacteria bacterium]|jgi:MFS family permease|uniref:MFS transporter n=1 Tax=Parvibaculum sp. TaxID=2024848 RepID=UPI000C427F46|nr:MFS transporter [Parvibaculum sp.]HAC57279.1 MFS transporter [Rhodobiaceae bacterium]HCO91695.1 MFS transporter [Alphaproteobacteria bacterium]MAU59213.1 MFS transporter [Parvibaculum sp.]MBO6669412.1 MFS transporter [Parvibaculum sp.]MBO6693769.1 MFS transporter [Parvibaculum sp.]|tara:strand:- start:1011 stop:2213 length:1203 start_codon:yes stop_codon:yes gene_type:complete